MGDSAEMIFSGDELLRGDTLNTNQPYLGERLLELGIFATHALCVADDLQAVAGRPALGTGALGVHDAAARDHEHERRHHRLDFDKSHQDAIPQAAENGNQQGRADHDPQRLKSVHRIG